MTLITLLIYEITLIAFETTERILLEMARHAIKRNKKNIKNRIIFLICIIIFIYSAVQIIMWVKSNIDIKKQEQMLKETVILKVEPEQQGKAQKKIDFDKLNQINSDVVGWIEIENTDINYPIVQSNDNEYYLKKDIYKEYNSGGSIFMDYQNSSDFSDDNTVIYGHHLRLGKMFSDLEKILNNELGNEIVVKIYTSNIEKQYKVISTYKSEPIKDPINTKIIDKKAFIETILNNSIINFNIMPNEQDNILTLSTCDSSGKKRIIVHAVEIISLDVE